MSQSGLSDRLRRLRRTGDPPLAGEVLGATAVAEARAPYGSPGAALPALEAALLGSVADGLSLKERLERLVAVAARGRSRTFAAPARPAAVPLEELVQGRRVENELGEFFMVEDDVHLETLHGGVPLSRVHALCPDAPAILTGDPELSGFDLGHAVFLDTETTGLAGGTGTAAFLIGIGFVEGDRFRLRQYFMRDYHEEAALLLGLAQDLARFPRIVTFNGKIFDVPLLESRYRMNRARFPLTQAPHLDLLFPARRLWKARLESCRLQSLEASLLGVRRVGDVPGEEIPAIYFDFVRRRDGRAMARVLDHNRIDVLSLAALSVLACQWVEGAHAEDPRDLYSLGRVLERAQLGSRAEEQYRRLLAAEATPLRVPSLLRLAARAKREGRHETAVELWEEAACEGDWWALRELALFHEHRSRDLEAALRVVDRALAGLEDRTPTLHRVVYDFRRRRDRIMGKQRRAAPVTA
jgi:uncharacterized protein YprB with RNaseH-like and TPR domain